MSGDLPRDVLLRERWSKGTIETLSLEYIHRGAPGDRATLSGSNVDQIGRSFIELLDGTKIPFHRLTRIYRNEALLWERRVREVH